MSLRRTPSRKTNGRRLGLESLENRLVMTSIIGDWGLYSGDGHQVAQNSTDQELRLSTYRDLQSVSAAEHGTVALNADGTVHYTPATDFIGVDSFKYTYLGFSGMATETTAYVNVTESVYALPDWMRILPGSESTSLDILSNDYVFAGNQSNTSYYVYGHTNSLPKNDLVVIDVSNAKNGTLSIDTNGSGVTYTPDTGFEGIEEFTYTVRDSFGNESTATAKVHVTPDANNGRYSNAEHFFIDALSAQVKENQSRFGSPSGILGSFHGYKFLDFSTTNLIADSSTNLSVVANQATSDIEYSTTNTQVAGVDEGDILKRAGNYLYIATGRELKIVDVSDATNPSLAKTVSFNDAIVDLYVFEKRLTIITEASPAHDSGMIFVSNWQSATPSQTTSFGVHVMDTTNAIDTELVYSTEVDGDYRDSRFIDGTLYLVAGHNTVNRLDAISESAANDRFYESISDYVGRVTIDDVSKPTFTVVDGTGTRTEQLYDWADIPTTTGDDTSVGTIITFDTLSTSGNPIDTDVAEFSFANFEIYASTDAIYLTSQVQTQTGVALGGLGDWPTYGYETRIQKFDFLDNHTGVDLVATGNVDGTLADQFSADEYEGYFRIATTSNGGWGGEVSLFVMEQQGDELNIVGSVEDIAPGERIYSTRFDGDRGFITTYRKVDPLFVIDLSDPTTPTIEGELKIPSYSNYMQVINENYVLGIGRDANDGLYDGLQVSLFDVSDPKDPQLVAKYEFAGGRNTWSPVADAWNLLDHHAVTFVPETGILALPTYTSNSWGGGGATGTDEAISVLKIDTENVTVELLGSMQFDERANRSLFIGGYLYGISNEEVQVVNAMTPDTTIASVDLLATPSTAVLDLPMAAKASVVETTDDISAADSSDMVPDVNGDGLTTPIDAVMIANMANQHGFGVISDDVDARYDLNNDQKFTPLDFVMVVNQLNNQATADLEQENFIQPPFARAASAATVDYVFDEGAADQEEDESRESKTDFVFGALPDDAWFV